MDPVIFLSILAASAALFAARERRHRDMALAIGIAAGLAPAGWIVLPVLAGTAIARRIAGPTVAIASAAWITMLLLFGAPSPAMTAIDWQTPAIDLRGLATATGIGLAAWTAATASARPLRPRETEALALPCAILLPLLLPLGAGSFGLAILLLLSGVRLRDLPRPAANANPLPLRV